MKIPDLKEKDITLLEKEIDKMTDLLPAMKFFILPGGHVSVLSGIPADQILDAAAVASYGASDVGDLIGQLSTQLNSGNSRGVSPPSC